MTFGIVISSYKYGHLAAHAIESVLCQTRKFDKIWFVDDGMGDCEHLFELYPQIRYTFREQNLGVVANFNNMLSMVDTDYVMFLGADNWLRPDALELLAKPKQPDISMYDIIVTGELRAEIQQFYSHWMHRHEGDFYWSRKGAHHGSMLYNVEMAKKVGGYENNRTSARTDEDLNLYDKLLKAGATIEHTSEGLLYYRRHNQNFNKY
jgi:glycosyltransferase involved in cell wall biosynthesis